MFDASIYYWRGCLAFIDTGAFAHFIVMICCKTITHVRLLFVFFLSLALLSNSINYKFTEQDLIWMVPPRDRSKCQKLGIFIDFKL